jgi:hypothetical protein
MRDDQNGPDSGYRRWGLLYVPAKPTGRSSRSPYQHPAVPIILAVGSVIIPWFVSNPYVREGCALLFVASCAWLAWDVLAEYYSWTKWRLTVTLMPLALLGFCALTYALNRSPAIGSPQATPELPVALTYERVEPDPNGSAGVPSGTGNFRLVFGYVNASEQEIRESSCVVRYPQDAKLDEVEAARFVVRYAASQDCKHDGHTTIPAKSSGFLELNAYSLSANETQNLRDRITTLYFAGNVNFQPADGPSHSMNICVFNMGSSEVYVCRL